MAGEISFSGLASGIDTESIIQSLLEAQRTPIERLEDKTEVLAMQREALRDVNTQLMSLQNTALDLRLESTYSTRKASSSDESILTASATFSATKTTHRVTVEQLAQEASVSSGRYLSQARLLGTNTMGINLLGGALRNNSPGAGRIKGSDAVDTAATLGSLGISDFTLRIDPDGSGKHSAIEITGLDSGTTVGQLINRVREQVDSVKIQTIRDEAAGGNVMQLASDFSGVDVSVSGEVAEVLFGIGNGATASSAGGAGTGSARTYAATAPSDVVQGTYTVVSSDGHAGSITGGVDLAAAAGGGEIRDITLDSLGVTEFAGFKIDPDAGGATGNIDVRKSDGTTLSGSDTIGDLIDAINHSVPDVTAQVVEGAGGASHLRVTANEGGRDVTMLQIGANNGFLKRVFDINQETTTSSNATSDSGDFTIIQTFYRRGSITPDSRRVVSGAKDDYRTTGVNDLIDGVTVVGSASGEVFTPGVARIQVNSSNGIAIENSSRTQLFGVTGVTDSSWAASLGLDTDGSGTIGLNRAIKDLNAEGAFALDDGAGITAGSFQVGDRTLTITQDELDNGLSLGQLLARINGAGQGMVVRYEESTDRFMATASEYGSQQSIELGTYTGAEGTSNVLKVLGLTNAPESVVESVGSNSGSIDTDSELTVAGFSIKPTSGTFSINGIAIEVDAQSDSLDDIIQRINSSAAGVTATVDTTSKRVSLIQNVDENTADDYIRVGSSSDTSNLLRALRITGGANSDASITDVESPKTENNVGNQRQTAELVVDGIHYTRNTNSIDDITPGITYELLGVGESPATVTVTGDTDRAMEAIAKFVAEYNKTIKLLNPEQIDQDEREYLDPITDEERANLTYEELLERLDKFESYNKSETIRKDSNLQVLEGQLRESLYTRIDIPGSSLKSIADLGISSGEAGSPITQDYEGVLVADSTDWEEILEVLQNNEALKTALEEEDRNVYRLFGQDAFSETSVEGTVAFDQDTPLANDISFQVYDGTNSAHITLAAGQWGRNTALSFISGQMQRAGIENITASFDAAGHLQFHSETTTDRAYIRILETTADGATDTLSSRFGITGGSYLGQDADEQAGVAEKLTNRLYQATGISGYISRKVSTGGNYGQGTIFDEIVQVQEEITRVEERVEKREQYLRSKFTYMEQVVAQLQEQQNALSQFMQTASSTTFGGSSGGSEQ